METEKRDFELSFEDVLLLKLGLIELKRSYSSLSEGLVNLGLSDDAVDFIERIPKIEKLESMLHF